MPDEETGALPHNYWEKSRPRFVYHLFKREIAMYFDGASSSAASFCVMGQRRQTVSVANAFNKGLMLDGARYTPINLTTLRRFSVAEVSELTNTRLTPLAQKFWGKFTSLA